MTTSMHLGPRGWAVLTLLGGAALSAPFMRTESTAPTVGEAIKHPSNPWNAQLPGEASVPIDSPQLPAGGNSIHSRFVSGELPTTSVVEHKPTELPAWVRERSPLDELIDRTSTSAPDTDRQAHTSVKPQAPVALRPWRENAVTSGTPSAATATPHPESLAAGDRLRSLADADPFASTTTPMVALGRNDIPDELWPDQQLLPALNEIAQAEQRSMTPRSFGESSPGNLVGTSLRRLPVGEMKDEATRSNQSAVNSTTGGERTDTMARSRKFVFQPGFQGTSAYRPQN